MLKIINEIGNLTDKNRLQQYIRDLDYDKYSDTELRFIGKLIAIKQRHSDLRFQYRHKKVLDIKE